MAERPRTTVERDRLRDPRVAAVVVAALCAAWIVAVLVTSAGGSSGPDSQTSVFGDRPNRAEMWIQRMDGAHFAQLAVDPLYQDTVEHYRGNPDWAAYRSLRPVLGWVEWALSLGGQRALLAPAVLGVTVVTIGALPLALAAVARALRREVVLPVAVVATPAVVANFWAPGLCEPLATVIVLGGLTLWLRDRRAAAVVVFCIAAITRETTLAVPFGIALAGLVTERRIRPFLPLLAAPLTYAAWAGFVSVRVGAFSSTRVEENGFQPVVGFVRGVGHWQLAEVVTALVVVASMIAVLRLREPILTGIVVAHVAVLMTIGTVVWAYWWGFGRILLPLNVLALLGSRRAADTDADTSGDVDAGVSVPATA